jgi:hypothetical protein
MGCLTLSLSKDVEANASGLCRKLYLFKTFIPFIRHSIESPGTISLSISVIIMDTSIMLKELPHQDAKEALADIIEKRFEQKIQIYGYNDYKNTFSVVSHAYVPPDI